MSDTYDRLGVAAMRLTGDAAIAIHQGDLDAAYLRLAESLNLQQLLGTNPDLADRTAGLMHELAAAVQAGSSAREAEVARLKKELARLELDASARSVEAQLMRLREDLKK